MCTLRRLFPLLATIASYSPEAGRQAGNMADNCGEGGVSEIAKSSIIGLVLAFSIAKLYGFAGLRVFPEVFSGRIRPENSVRMHSR